MHIPHACVQCHILAHATRVHSTPWAHAYAVCVSHALCAYVTYTTRVHMLPHSHAHTCFPAPQVPGFPCPAQTHHQALSASAWRAGGSMRTRSYPHPLGGYRGGQGCGELQKDQVFPTPARGGGGTGVPRVPGSLPSILAQEPRFPGSCKPDTDLVMDRGVQYLHFHKTTRQATNDHCRAALVSTPSLLAHPPPPPTRPAPQGRAEHSLQTQSCGRSSCRPRWCSVRLGHRSASLSVPWEADPLVPGSGQAGEPRCCPQLPQRVSPALLPRRPWQSREQLIPETKETGQEPVSLVGPRAASAS